MGASSSAETASDDPIVAADETTSPFLPATSEDAPEDLVQTYDDPLICCCCDGGFDTDLSLVKSPTHQLPITCRECFNCTCCFQCLKKCSNEANNSVAEEEATTEVTCPDCMRVGFDVKDVYPDRNLCYLLLTVRKLVEERKAMAALGVEESPAKTKYRVGQKLKKKFGGKWFLGEITDFRQVTVYSVQYEDGDSEEMEEVCLRDDNIVFLEGRYDENRKTPKKRSASRVVTPPSFHETRSKKEVGRTRRSKKRPISTLGCDDNNRKNKKSKKSRKTAGNAAGTNDESSWLSVFDRLFPSEDSHFPKSFDEVVRVMDTLLSEKEGVYFEDTFNKGTNKYQIKRILFKLEEQKDPRLAWHEPYTPWGPPTREALKEFILLLLRIARSDKRINCIRRFSPGRNSSERQPKPNTTKNSKNTRKDTGTRTRAGKKDKSWLNEFDRIFPCNNSGLPKNFLEVLRVMNTLLSENEGIDFENVLNSGPNRRRVNTILFKLEEKKDPRVIWHEPCSPWGPPTKEALKEFILLLLTIARSRGSLEAGKLTESITEKKKSKKSKKKIPGEGANVAAENDNSWLDKFERLFPRDNSMLPKSIGEVVCVMDTLLSEREGINFMEALHTGTNKSRLSRSLCKLEEKKDPRLAWHKPYTPWGPPTKEALKEFILLLLGIARNREKPRECGVGFEPESQGRQGSKGSKSIDTRKRGDGGNGAPAWKSELRTLDELPTSFPEVLKLMDELLGDEDYHNVTRETHRTRSILNLSTENYPDHPGLAWHTPGESWCPPDVESLESFIELLLEFSRRRRRGETVSLISPRDDSSDDDDDGGGEEEEATWQEKLRALDILPTSLPQVLKLMDNLLGEEEKYSFTEDIGRTRQILNASKEKYPDHPGLAWHSHTDRGWCPPDVDSLESFIELLLEFSRRRRRGERISLDLPTDDSSDDDDGSGDEMTTWQEKLRTLDELPTSLPEVLKLMDELLGDEEQCTFTQDTKRTRNVLYKSTATVPDHPGLAWHTPGESWCPPDVESLESFIELLLEFSRRRRRGERMSLELPEDDNCDDYDNDDGIGDGEVTWQEKLRTIDELPKSLPQVLKLMDDLLGDEEHYNFTQNIGRTRDILNISIGNFPDHPGLAWRSHADRGWCPPDVESLESFIELLLEFSRRRRRGERVSLTPPDSSDDEECGS